MKTLTAPVPQATFLGALKNLGVGLYQATAKFASYNAATMTPTTRVGSRIGSNPNSTFANMQRVGMGWSAEDVFKNSSLGAAYILQRINYCSALMTYIPGTGDAGLDAELKAYLQGDDGCGGIFGSMGVDCSMQDAVSRTADIECPIRGDAGLIFWEDESGDLRLIEFSADQLGEIYSFTRERRVSLARKATGEIYEVSGSDCVYFAGRYFRGADCVAYKIYERTDAWYGSPQIYDAADVFYFRDPSSFRGVRGVTKFATAIQHMAKGEDLFQIGMDAALRQAKTAFYVTNGRGGPDETTYDSDTGYDGRTTYSERIPGGPLVEYGFTGDTMAAVSPDSPGPELIQGVETSDERVALALGMNYAFLISATKVGGAPSRLEINKAAKEFQRIQNKIIRPKLSRMQNIVILSAVRRGIFPAKENITRGRWVLPISPSVDAFYDAKENIAMMRAGLESAEDIIAETNRDADDILEKSKQWAIKCAMKVEDANNELTRLGYKPTVTAMDIAQVSDNPQQAAQAEQVDSGMGNPANKETAKMQGWDESKHPRGQPENKGEFGPGGGSVSSSKKDTSEETKKGPKGKSSATVNPTFDMKADMKAQAEWMAGEAKSSGHESVDEMLAKNPAHFAKLAGQWRAEHPRTAPPVLSEKAQRAKDSHHMVDAKIQRYAEEHNEPKVAKALGGISFPDSEPIDIAIAGENGVVKHGVELKTVVSNKGAKITMKGDAIARKRSWERKNKATIHTVVIDDSEVFNAKGDGKHDESKRKIYYRRGYGSFRIGGMHPIKDMTELRAIMDVPTRKLPPAAK